MLKPGMTRKNFLVLVGAMETSLNISTVHLAAIMSSTEEIGHGLAAIEVFCV
jgi:hypothetical protein